jgi:hypothetical protein
VWEGAGAGDGGYGWEVGGCVWVRHVDVRAYTVGSSEMTLPRVPAGKQARKIE